MKLDELRAHIRTLISFEPADTPFVSVYLDLSGGAEKAVRFLDGRFAALEAALEPSRRAELREARRPIAAYVPAALPGSALGAALFSRAGDSPFFLALTFQVPLESHVVVQSLPSVYGLVELKDTFDRYVILLAGEDTVRVFEVNVGEATEEAVRTRPDVAERVSETNARKRYERRRTGSDAFLDETVRLLDRVVAQRGHSHLVLAGPPRLLERVREALPKHLSQKLLDPLPVTPRDRTEAILSASLARFVEKEEEESRAVASRLIREIRRGGLGVAGLGATREALANGQVDVLVVLRSFDPPAGEKDELARLAERTGAHVEVVAESAGLAALGGVGALLRFAPATAC